MQRFELLQKRPQRHRRENSVPSTFPERHETAHGDPGKDADEFLDTLEVILAQHDELVHRLGHLGLEA